MDAATGRKRASWRLVLVVGLGIAVSAAMYAAGVGLYFAAQHGPPKFVKNPSRQSRVQLDALVRPTSIDPNRGDLTLRVEVRPGPGLVGSDGVSVTRAVSIDIVGGTGTASYRYGPGDRISPIDLTIGAAGNVNSYPFDSYKSVFAVVVVASPSGGTSLQGAAAPAVRARLAFDGTLSGYRIAAGPLRPENDDPNTLALHLAINRARLTETFAILILILQALLAATAAALALVIWRRHRRAEIPMLTWLAALLFAIVPLRNAMPGAPPIGALVDVLIFFWAVTIIALSLVCVLVAWARQSPAQN